MNSAQKFQEKYGLSATKLIDDLNVKFLGLIKTIGLQKLLDTEISKITDEKIVVNNEFYKLLVEAMAEEGEKFPQNQKVTLDDGTILEIPSVQPSMPTSKGLLEDFKNVVSTDELRPAMTGVYVSEDNLLVGTNAHILVKFYGSNEFTNNHKGKIIDLKNYLASKGRRIDDIDQKYPNYDAVIPKDNSIKKTISLYALYNLAKSAVATSKLIDNNPFVLHLSIEGNEFYVSPVLLADLCAFWLAKGKQSTEVQFGAPNRAILFVFDSEDVGLLMPCMGKEDIIKSKLYSLEQVDKEFDGGKAKAKAAKKAPIPKKSEDERKEAFKKFEGDIKSDSEYISRREIDRVILKNGDVLYTNDIVDGIYKVKGKKFGDGGGVNQKEFIVETEMHYERIFAKNAQEAWQKWTKLHKDDTIKDSIIDIRESENDKEYGLGGFLLGAAVGGAAVYAFDKSDAKQSSSKSDSNEINTWQEEVLSTIDNQGFDETFDSFSDWKEIDDVRFHQLRRSYLQKMKALKNYIDGKDLVDPKYDISVKDAVEKEGFDYTFDGYHDWKAVKDSKFQELLKNYKASRKSLETYLHSDGGSKGKNKYGLGGVAQSYGSPMIESGMQGVTGNWGGSPVSVFEKGGKIKNQYKDKSANEIWDMLSKEQRQHFLYDHKDQIEAYRGEEYGELTSKEITKAYNSNWSELDKNIRNRFDNHVREGEYAKGGKIGFEGLAKKVAKRYSGKKVKPKYQGEYGKEYDSKEAKEVGRKVAAKVYRQQQGKMANGGEVGQEIEFEFSYIDSGSPLKQRAKILSKNGDYYKVKVINGIMKGQTTDVHKSLIVKKMADGGFVGDLAGSDLTPTIMGGGLGNVQDSIMAKGGRTKVYAIKKIKK